MWNRAEAALASAMDDFAGKGGWRVTNFHQHQRERDSLFRRRAGAAPSSAHDDLLEAEDSYARSGNQVDRGVLSLAHRC